MNGVVFLSMQVIVSKDVSVSGVSAGVPNGTADRGYTPPDLLDRLRKAVI
jgi:hypothetical protein